MTKRNKGEGLANQETWQEWIGVSGAVDPDALLTINEVLASVNRFRPPTERTSIKEIDVWRRRMNDWMRRGFIPRGVWCGKGYSGKRWPWWVADLLYLVRRYRDVGIRSTYLRQCMRMEAFRLAQDPLPRLKERLQPPVDPTTEGLWDFLTRTIAVVPREPQFLPFEREPTSEKIQERLAKQCEGGFIAALALWQQLTGEQGVRRLTLQLISDTDTILSSCDIAIQEEGIAASLLTAFQDQAHAHLHATLFDNILPPAS